MATRNVPTIPAQFVPPLDSRGGDATLPPLMANPWWLPLKDLFDAARGMASDIADLIANAVVGRGALTHAGAIPKVGNVGALVESAATDDGTNLTLASRKLLIQQTISGVVQPMLELDSNITSKVRISRATNTSRIDIAVNLYFDGVAWNLDDVSLPGALIALASGQVEFYSATAGANPRILLNTATTDPNGNVDIAGVYKVAGTQVLGARLGAITAPSISTSNTASTAGATYTATEQGMLNALKAAVALLNADVVSLQTAINDTRSRLSTTGITA